MYDSLSIILNPIYITKDVLSPSFFFVSGIMIRRILCQSNSNSEIINNGNSYGKENRENSHSSENSITTGADIKIDQSISSKITLTLLWIAPRITSMIFLIILLIWIVQDEGVLGLRLLSLTLSLS
jgi:hypothetical protein